MVNETNIEFSFNKYLWWKLRLAIGRWLNSYVEPASKLKLIINRNNVLKVRSPGSYLSSEEVARLKEYMLDVQDRVLRMEYFKTTPIERTFQGLTLSLLKDVIPNDQSIKKVVNIGASFAYIDSLLAQEYPDINFLAIDFAVNLAEYNKDLSQNNLTFKSGYAMDIFEDEGIEADICFFGNAAYEIKNLEIQRYFKLFYDNGVKYIVLNEPIYPLPGGAITNPLDLPIDESTPVYSHQGVGNHQLGPLGRVHNYKEMLNNAGYTLTHYHVFRPKFTDLRVINVIAEHK